MKITNKYGPNVTVLLPGSCNAKCDFCFWDRDSAKIRPPEDYLDRVFSILENLPKEFRTLSISGGEPTLSPWLPKFLSRLGVWRRTHHLDRVVFTTHGGNLGPHIEALSATVDHINISRHAIDDADNEAIFKTGQVPSSVDLRNMIDKIHDIGTCDVTLNCVVQPDVKAKFCKAYIKYAKGLDAYAVSFRKVASDVSPTKAELKFIKKYGMGMQTDCPVCRGMEQRVDGFPVRWKGSVAEPSLTTKGVYEVVIHPDGKAYTDWGRTKQLKIPSKPARRKAAHDYSGCGGHAGGCGAQSKRSSCGSSGCGGFVGRGSSC